jgi:hypothetical protein
MRSNADKYTTWTVKIAFELYKKNLLDQRYHWDENEEPTKCDFMPEVARTGSAYFTFRFTNGQIFRIRFADHNASWFNGGFDYTTNTFRDARKYIMEAAMEAADAK